jgi:hypothetical protein
MPKLEWKLLTKKRGSSTQGIPPGKEDLACENGPGPDAGQLGRRLGRHVTWTTTGRATDEAPVHSKTLGQEP